MSNKVDVSVCIPTFNSAETIRICLNSIFQQTVSPTEVLVCDGGSYDDTLKIVSGYPVKIVGKNVKGVGMARKILVSSSLAELIAWIDADASIPKNWLEIQVKLHKKQLDVLSNPTFVVSVEDGKRLSHKKLNAESFKVHRCNFVSWTAVTMKRQAIEKAGGFDPIFEYDGDFDLTTRLNQANARLYKCNELRGYHMCLGKEFSFRKQILGGNFILYLLKYGFQYIKLNPRHFISFMLRLWLLYSVLLFFFIRPLVVGALFTLFAVICNLMGGRVQRGTIGRGYLFEQFLKAIGEHRNLIRYVKSRYRENEVRVLNIKQ